MSVVFTGHSVFSTNTTDRHDITEILLKVEKPSKLMLYCHNLLALDGQLGLLSGNACGTPFDMSNCPS
jgi:hypothetical protein